MSVLVGFLNTQVSILSSVLVLAALKEYLVTTYSFINKFNGTMEVIKCWQCMFDQSIFDETNDIIKVLSPIGYIVN